MNIYFNQDEENAEFCGEISNLYNIALILTNKPQNICVNIIDVSPEEIQKMNKCYRNVDRVTDVLSFPMIDNFDNIEKEPDYALGECNIGDIYINPTRAHEQAKDYGHSYKREYCFLALHGFLHLLGYDHMSQEQEKEMFSLQEKILKEANIGRD